MSGKHRKQRLPFSFLAEIRPFALPLRVRLRIHLTLRIGAIGPSWKTASTSSIRMRRVIGLSGSSILRSGE
jgi:hypothetical protein